MRERKKLIKGYYIIMYLMMSIFVSAPILQSFHSHDQSTSSSAADQEILYAHEADCQLCYHFAHQQVGHHLSLTPFSIVFIGNIPSIPLTHHVWGLISLPGLSWTNKGPPAPAA
mgnify:CR=1 FL=1